MSAGNVSKFDAGKADKRRLIRRIFSLNTWPISDDGIDGWIIDLNKGGFWLSDFEYAIGCYKNAGESRPPRYGNLVEYMKVSKAGNKDRRKAEAERLPEPSEADWAAGRAVLDKLHVDAMPELSREQQDDLLARLDAKKQDNNGNVVKDKKGNPIPETLTLPDYLANPEPASGDPARPGPVKPESDLLAEARARYPEPKPKPEPDPEPKEAEAEENRLLDEARERYKNMPAQKEVPGVGEMYFPEVLPSPHTREPGKK